MKDGFKIYKNGRKKVCSEELVSVSLQKRCSRGFRPCSSEVTGFEYNWQGLLKLSGCVVGSAKNLTLDLRILTSKVRGHVTHWASSFQLLQLEENAFILDSSYPYRMQCWCEAWLWSICADSRCRRAAQGVLLWNRLPGFSTSTPRASPPEMATPFLLKVFTSPVGQHMDSER